MLAQTLGALLLLLGLTVAVVLVFQRLKIPSCLGYLFVGLLLSSHTAGPAIDGHYVRLLAEFGIVFLLFTIGLSFPVAHIYSLRHVILGAGTAQATGISLIKAVLAFGAFLAGMTLGETEYRHKARIRRRTGAVRCT